MQIPGRRLTGRGLDPDRPLAAGELGAGAPADAGSWSGQQSDRQDEKGSCRHEEKGSCGKKTTDDHDDQRFVHHLCFFLALRTRYVALIWPAIKEQLFAVSF